MNLEDVKPLDIEKYLGKVKNRIALAGVELEGGWVDLPPDVKEVVHDGSVFNGRLPEGIRYIGELPIGPAVPAAIPELMRIHYPCKMNNTCGMHVHMSFDTLWYYQLLMVPQYQETVVYYLKQWAHEVGLKDSHTIWDRLNGKSEFCQKKFWPDVQARTKRKGHDRNVDGHRYTIIHYCGRPMMNTIECRVLPMLPNAKQSIRAVQRLFDITNACLYALGTTTKRDKTNTRIELPNNVRYTESIIEQL